MSRVTQGRRAAALQKAAALAFFTVALILSGCANRTGHGAYDDTDADVAAAIDRDVTPMGFTVCHGYGCWKRSAAALAPAEWKAVLTLFEPPAPDAAAERARVSEAIALIEKSVAPRIGTAHDAAGAPLNFGDYGQLDCVDETINSSVYLSLLHRAGLLRWHEPGEAARRGSFYTFNVHFTATLRETRGGAHYAVDSWFLANGRPASVVPLALWRDGWRPGDPVALTTSAAAPAPAR